LDKIGTKKTLLLAGAILASAALFIMPNSPLWFAAGMLWMDASINVSMEPFRAFVGDNLPEKQRTMGLPCSFFIRIGAYFASKLPLIFYLSEFKYSSWLLSRFS
jgi:maltose/moltooligosaccharide transporter